MEQIHPDDVLETNAEVRRIAERAFPGNAGMILRLSALRRVSDAPLESGMAESGITRDGIVEALTEASKGFLVGGNRMAMDYRGFFTERARFCEYRENHMYDARPRVNSVLLASEDGSSPMGFIGLRENETELSDIIRRIEGTGCTLVTDREYYTDENAHAMSRAGIDVLMPLVNRASTANIHGTQELRWDGTVYDATKCRFDRRWLFRFHDPVAEKQEKERISTVTGIDKRTREHLMGNAGIEDTVSMTGFDIREVRRLLDARSAWDVRMRRHWRSMGSEPLVGGDSILATGYLAVSVLGEMLVLR